ncbi:putative cytochrome P450 E-class, group I [Rhypophila decipiens]|uniref:Cytochrome P450 E-class, group I n=1 Tax=Rhypophila decipiens TaxID=261697 RepID=A0AAN6Y7V3_9PEZI|nr:putative cytochrome P450 E-class, group I [Rhypophila decipiens]
MGRPALPPAITEMDFPVVLLMTLGLVLLAINRFVTRKRLPPGARELPGPMNLPLIGRVHDIPTSGAWLKFHEWSHQYGPIYQTKMFGTVHVWISSEQVAHDLLSKRATIYSDRPMIPNLPDNRTSGDYLALLGRTETWKRQRKICNNLMHTSALAQLHGYPTIERDRMLYLMLNDPSNYREWIEQFTARTVSRLSWGSAHPARVLRHTTFGLLETISPSGALPNVISFLRHVPAAISPWKQKEHTRHALETNMFRSNVGFVKKMMGTDVGAEPSFIRTFMEGNKTQEETDEAMNVVGLMAIAGALTIGSPIQSFLLAMCHYPEWQAKLQDEIDTALGGRCPQWEDREKLPMLRAVVKEVIRWRPPVPTGIPHAIEKDDVYQGYFIPAGATIHALEWAITRDENTYPDAEAFNPLRWLDPSFPTYREPLTQYPNLSGFSQFGFGRRTCQGVPIVEQDLFLTMGGMAWGLNIRKKRDPETGLEVPVHWNDYTPLLIAKPMPFPFDAFARSDEKRRMMKDMYEDANSRMQDQDMKGDDEVRAALGEYKKDVVKFAAEAGVAPVDQEIDDIEKEREQKRKIAASEAAGSSRSDSSPEPSLSSGVSSRDSETDLDESACETPMERELDELNFNGHAKEGQRQEDDEGVLVAEDKYFCKMQPAVTGSGVPGAWRWS